MKSTTNRLIIVLAILAVFLVAAWTPSGRARTSPPITPTEPEATSPDASPHEQLSDRQAQRAPARCPDGACPIVIHLTQQPTSEDFGYPVATVEYSYP
jgi:hypothetical protein